MRPIVPSGASRMTHHRTFWITSSAERLNARNGSALLPVRGAADDDADDHELQHVEARAVARDLEAEEVRRDQTGQEVDPRTGAARLAGLGGVDRRVRTRLQDQPEPDTDEDRDQRGDREPQ